MSLTNAIHKGAMTDQQIIDSVWGGMNAAVKQADDGLTIPAMPSLAADAAYMDGYKAGYTRQVMTLPADAAVVGFYRVGYGRGSRDQAADHPARYPVHGQAVGVTGGAV